MGWNGGSEGPCSDRCTPRLVLPTSPTPLRDTLRPPTTHSRSRRAPPRCSLRQLKERDDQINEGVEKISRGVDVLQEIALQQQEEVKKQNVMLEGLATHMDNVHDHVNNVNQKMKTTLDEVARSGDKFCIDALCILLLLGLIGVLYQLTSSR